MIDEKDIFERTRRLIGEEKLSKLKSSKVLVFGLGGVGSYVIEGLARAGVGVLGIVDRDVIAYSNINRQIIALQSTAGMKKTDAAAARLLDINPNISIDSYFLSYDEETAEQIDFNKYDYIVDAIDSVKSKLEIICRAKAANIPVISCMGTGFKLEPTRLKIADIYATTVCPLAKLMRKAVRAAGINNLKVLFSDEPPQSASTESIQTTNQNTAAIQSEVLPVKNVASISFVPSVAGLLIAAEVIKDLTGINN